jgi:hypothetical protein
MTANTKALPFRYGEMGINCLAIEVMRSENASDGSGFRSRPIRKRVLLEGEMRSAFT